MRYGTVFGGFALLLQAGLRTHSGGRQAHHEGSDIGGNGMRLLLWHVDHFASTPTTRGRSPVADAEPAVVNVDEAIVVFAQAEKADEANSADVAARTVAAIVAVADQLKARTLVLHSFAHLFGELSDPAVARQILLETDRQLAERGFAVHQTAFGWFNRLDLQAKGHPYSRQARQL
jgi:threonyl-tRNA synthetase